MSVSIIFSAEVECSKVVMAVVENQDGLAAINFSSGTTGYPKAIPMTHRMISDRANSDKKGNV